MGRGGGGTSQEGKKKEKHCIVKLKKEEKEGKEAKRKIIKLKNVSFKKKKEFSKN